MIELTQKEVRDRVKEWVEEIKDEYRRDQYDRDTDRETLIERMDEDCDTVWGSLVKHGHIAEYSVDDMVETAAACAAIIKTAQEDAWIEDDKGLWEGLTYGVQASIAYFSLRNLLYNALKNVGVDTNDQRPFAKVRWKKRK